MDQVGELTTRIKHLQAEAEVCRALSSDFSQTRAAAIQDEIELAEALLAAARAAPQAEPDPEPEPGTTVGGGQQTDPTRAADPQWVEKCQRFSVRRALLGMMGRQVDDGYEREVSAELAQRTGRSYEGVAVPMDALSTRQVSTTTPAGGPGSRIVPTDYRPEDFIPLLRDALVVNQLGARTLRGLSGDVAIPGQSASATGGWKSETGALDEDDPEFSPHITMSPKKVGIIGNISGRMLLQASPDIETLVRQDLAASLASVIDTAVIYGTGSGNQPTGVTVAVANTARSGDTNGKALSLQELIGLELALDDANVPMGARAFLCRSSVKHWARQQVRFAATDSRTLWEGDRLNGVKTVLSNMVVGDQSHGTGTDTKTHLIYGNWSDLIVGYWQDLDLLANPYEASAYKAGSVLIRGIVYMDVAVRRDAAFAWYDAITT